MSSCDVHVVRKSDGKGITGHLKSSIHGDYMSRYKSIAIVVPETLLGKVFVVSMKIKNLKTL